MRSVSARLTLLFVLVTAVILGIFSVSLYVWVADRVEKDIRTELDEQWRIFSRYFLEEYEEFKRGVHLDLAEEIQLHLDASGALAEVRRGDGSQIYLSPGFGPGWRILTGTVKATDGAVFAIRIGVEEAPYLQQLERLRMYFLVFCPVVLAVSGVLGFVFVKRALRPVDRIRRQAERISRANVSDRVSEPDSTGEFLDLARTFNEMLDRLERSIQDLENFAADAAHELRTPLANLRAEIETALEHCCREDEGVLLSLSEEVSRMNRVVGDLFTLTKLDMRQYALARERVELGPILEETCETWRRVAAERGITVRWEGGSAAMQGDAAALRRVFMNLVENGVKYSRQGGEVAVSVECSGGRILVRVADTGIGIPSEHLPLIFRRFYRVEKARSREAGGAGLGLAICKSFIEAHGGRIDVSSTSGKGSIFTVELPQAS